MSFNFEKLQAVAIITGKIKNREHAVEPPKNEFKAIEFYQL